MSQQTVFRQSCLALLGIVLFHHCFAGEVVLYAENFDGELTADLNGKIPTVSSSGAPWIASGFFKQDGTINNPLASGTATLAFTPLDGMIYTLKLTVTASYSQASGSSVNDWIAVGFAKGQNTLTGNAYRFTGQVNNPPANLVVGRAWMLLRGSTELNPHQSWLGRGNSGTIASIQPAENWSGTWVDEASHDLKIVLDTTEGSGNWTATWYAKASSDEDDIVVRTATPILDEEITSVGIARSNFGVIGRVSNFSLTAESASPDKLDLELKITHLNGALSFAWNSSPKRQYDLVSTIDPAFPISSWEVYDDGIRTYQNLPSSATGQNLLDGVLPKGAKRFFAILEKP